MARLILVIGILVIGILAACNETLGADQPPPGIPKEIKQAEQAINKWVHGFETRTVADVLATLGTPTTESIWIFKDEKQPLLKFKVGDTGMLSLYIRGGRVSFATYGQNAD